MYENNNLILQCKTEDERDEMIIRLFNSIWPPPREKITYDNIKKLKKNYFDDGVFDKYYIVEDNIKKYLMISIPKKYSNYMLSITFDRSLEYNELINLISLI